MPRTSQGAGLGRLRKRREPEEEDFTGRLVTILEPTSAASEAYRTLRTNLLYSFIDTPPKVIVLTSAGPSEGKSTTCANLGVVLAQAAKRVLILDCDLRKPVIHRFFELRNLHGITDVLIEERGLEEVWEEPVEGLKVVPSGPVPLHPTEVLGSRRFSDFLANVREWFDYVLVDASPVGPVSDPVVLATKGDGVLLILDAQNTSPESLRGAMDSLRAVGANVLGTVMNNAGAPKDSYYYYGLTDNE